MLGIQFAFMYLIAYASSRTLSTAYGYSPIKIGFVSLSLGVGKFFPIQNFSNGLITGFDLWGVQELLLVVCGVADGLIMTLHA